MSKSKDPTQKFKEHIAKEKETKEQLEATTAGKAFLIQLLVGICQVSLIYLAYYILSKHFNLINFTYWEFGGILLGTFALLTYIKNYIKDIFTYDRKTD